MSTMHMLVIPESIDPNDPVVIKARRLLAEKGSEQMRESFESALEARKSDKPYGKFETVDISNGTPRHE